MMHEVLCTAVVEFAAVCILATAIELVGDCHRSRRKRGRHAS